MITPSMLLAPPPITAPVRREKKLFVSLPFISLSLDVTEIVLSFEKERFK